MLTEEMRLFAGLQESKTVVDPLPQLMEDERQQILNEKQRALNEKKSVLSDFDTFQSKIEKYKGMIEVVSSLCEGDIKAEFITGLLESKYSTLQKFADVVINDDFITAMSYLEDNYYFLRESIDRIQKLIETLDEEGAPTYFVAKSLVSQDNDHDLNVFVFKTKTLEEKISSEIEYGSEIIYLSENVSSVRCNGKKYYSKFTASQIEMLEKKGFLI